jgi:hypothetical protein
VVISYDLSKQLELVKGAAFTLRGFSVSRRLFLIVGVTVVAGASLLAAGWLLRQLAVSAEKRLLQRFLRLIQARFGIKSPSDHLGLKTLADRTGDARCQEFAAIYNGAIYRDRVLRPAERARLRSLLKALRKA